MDLWRNWKRRRSRRRARRSCSVLMGAPPPLSLRGAKRRSNPMVGAQRQRDCFAALAMTPLSLLLPFLAADLFGRVADSLALVRLRSTETPDLRSHLTDQALIHACHLDRGRPLA